jgi:hypothetical protein
MVPQTSHHAAGHNEDLDGAEEYVYDSTRSLTALPPLAHIYPKTWLDFDSIFSPISRIHEGSTPYASVPSLPLSWPAGWQLTDLAANKTRATKTEDYSMDPLSSLVHRVPKVLHICHFAQSGRDYHGFTQSIPLRRETPRCFGAW